MKFIIKPLQWLYCIYALLAFVALMLGVFPFVIVALFFGKIKGGNFIYKVCRIWGFVWYFMVGIRHKNIYEAPHDSSCQYIIVANHISYLDIPPVFLSFTQPVRALGKSSLAKIPVFGFIYRHAAILVDRSSIRRRAETLDVMKYFLQRHVSIFIFPEGTFNETGKPLKSFYDGAFRIAIETQTPIKPVLFIDTLHRLHYRSIFSLTPGISRTIFLKTISVEGLTLEDVGTLKLNVYRLMEKELSKHHVNAHV